MKRFAILGVGQLGDRIARQLAENGQDVLAIDSNEDAVTAIKEHVSLAMCADITDEAAMREAGLEDVEAAVITVGDAQLVTILSTAILRKIGVPRIIARSASPIQTRILKLVGANEVIEPEFEVGRQIAERLTTPGFFDVLRLRSGQRLVEMDVLADWAGRTISDIAFRKDKGVNVVGIRRTKHAVNDAGESVTEEVVLEMPAAGDRLETGDVLLLLGPSDRIDALRKEA